MSKAIYTKSIL